MKNKEWCVHITPATLHYEGIMARTPREAERIALREWPDSEEYEGISIMRTCSCGYDNEPHNKKCEECGANL